MTINQEDKEKAARAKVALLDTEENASLFVAWLTVFGFSKEFAEMILDTELA